MFIYLAASSVWATAPAFFRPGQKSPLNLLFLLHRITDFCYEFIRVLCLMRADVVYVEHRLSWLVTVSFHPCDHSSIDIRDLGVASLVGAACDRYLRKRSELHMLSIGVVSPDGLPRHHIHIFFLVFAVEIGNCAKAGIILP